MTPSTDPERRLLERVRRGDFDGVTRTPAELRPLLQRGLICASPLLPPNLPPRRYRFQLTEQGRQRLRGY